ncbi:MAG: winged helix-turn-helix domain-containing protein [Acidobacteriota bacterium]|nr:winged helix-turn-helix domain-containing protein [Acidobacteriota bacterium]
MSLEISHIYKFENYLLDLNERVLLRDGKPLPVTPKVFHLLTILVKNHGRIVEKEKLLSEIWADSFVEEGNLTFNVRMLRKALGDDAAKPTFIETVPRRGYRFIAEVEEIPTQISAPEEPHKVLQIAKRQSGHLFYVVISLAFIAVSIALVTWYLRTTSANSPVSAPILFAPFGSEKLSNSGKVDHAVISPDGKLVAYTNESGGKYSIWLRRLENAENVQIVPPSDNHYYGLNFSRDGNSIFFARKPFDNKERLTLFRLSISAGMEEKILETTEGWFSLSPDDQQISFVRCERTDADFCSLFVADADGKNERKILTRPRPIRISDNQFSPDGKSIAFAAGQSWNGGSDFRLLRVDLGSGAESLISSKTFFNIKNLEWLPGGEGLLLAAMENLDGRQRIWRVSAATGEAEPLMKDATNYSSISLTKNADKIVATQLDNDFQLYFSTNGETKPLTASRGFSFAPDGKLVYETTDGDIWTINRDGSEQRQLTNNPFNDIYPLVSPDNQFIFFTSNRTGSNQVWRMTRDGNNQTQITKREGGYPRFVSQDGKWVYYESGLHQTLWRVATESGEEIQVSDRKMDSPAFSSDGNLATYFFRDKEWKIGIMSLSDNKQIKVLNYAEGKLVPVRLAWSADNRTLNFVTKYNFKNLLWQQSLDQDKPRFIADLGDKEIHDFALAPDGNGFAYVRGSWLHDAVLITGFK